LLNGCFLAREEGNQTSAQLIYLIDYVNQARRLVGILAWRFGASRPLSEVVLDWLRGTTLLHA
jgi:hypothetical protein